LGQGSRKLIFKGKNGVRLSLGERQNIPLTRAMGTSVWRRGKNTYFAKSFARFLLIPSQLQETEPTQLKLLSTRVKFNVDWR